MSQYIDLVNKVIDESACEADKLTTGTWSTAAAGRRIYPRIKANVADAWKLIQMDREEWEFTDTEFNGLVYPRIRVNFGNRSSGAPSIGATYQGALSNFLFTVNQVFLISGDWTLGTAIATIEFIAYTGSHLQPGETFIEVTPTAGVGTFIYDGKGSYNWREVDPTLREIQWESFASFQNNSASNPVTFVPWDNWLYHEISFTQGSQSAPMYVSQDFNGNTVFYPQTLNPFRVSFIYNTAPQILVNPTDIPAIIPAEYHDWIAWRALMMFAQFDKNSDLYNYAKTNNDFYETKAESNLMPLISWGYSKFNHV